MSGADAQPAGQLRRACALADVAAGCALGVEIDGVPVVVAHTADGGVYALENECSHATVPLSEGELDGTTLECWLHGSRFDLRTGKPTGPPATAPVSVYPVEIRDGFVYVSLASSNGVQS